VKFQSDASSYLRALPGDFRHRIDGGSERAFTCLAHGSERRAWRQKKTDEKCAQVESFCALLDFKMDASLF
jgi:hypothetical protein